MSTSRAELAASIVRVSHELHKRGWVANHDGNVSVRLAQEGRFLVTPTAVSKVDVREGNLAVVDGTGKAVEGEVKPPSEFALHLACYAERPDVRAVVHAHPPFATALACAGQGFRVFLPEAVVSLGLQVPLADFALPYGEDGAAPVRRLIGRYDALLLCSHGAITVGCDVQQALLRMELVEHLAVILAQAKPLGGVRELEPEALRVLVGKRREAKLGLAAERTRLPGDDDETGSVPPAWTPAGPPPAEDAWASASTPSPHGPVVHSTAQPPGQGEELLSVVRAAVEEHLRGRR